MLPSNQKNSNTSPSHRMQYTGTRKPCRALFQSPASHQRMINHSSKLSTKCRLTVTLCYYLSNCIQALFCTAGFKLKFDEKNRNRTKRLEVIHHPAFGGDMTFRNGFGQIPKSKGEYGDKTIKDLRENFDIVCGMKSWLAPTGDRNWDLASAVSCSIGGPYCTNIISISCTMDWKRAVGMRERWSSKVLISLSLRPASSPTNDAMETYLTLEKLTSMRSSLKGSSNPVSSQIKRQWTDRTRPVATGSDRNHALPLYEGEPFQRKHDS